MESYLKIPADFKIKNINKIVDINERAIFPIKYVYGSIPFLFPSARANYILPKLNIKQFEKYVGLLKKHNISFNYLINTFLNNQDFSKIKKNIHCLIDIGIDNFTIADTRFISFLEQFNVNINLSVVVGISDDKKVNKYTNKEVVNSICLIEDLNREIDMLKKILQSTNNLDFEIIINSLCLFNCPFRNKHYRQIPTLKKNDIDKYGVLCDKVRLNNPLEIIKAPWITPTCLNNYSKIGVRFFKISGRELINDNSYKYIKLYANATPFNENLMDLLLLGYDGYYNKTFYVYYWLANELINAIWFKQINIDILYEEFFQKGIIKIDEKQLSVFNSIVKKSSYDDD